MWTDELYWTKGRDFDHKDRFATKILFSLKTIGKTLHMGLIRHDIEQAYKKKDTKPFYKKGLQVLYEAVRQSCDGSPIFFFSKLVPWSCSKQFSQKLRRLISS
jgi:hypothetical protein